MTAAGRSPTALTLHGAIGYTWEHDLPVLLKRAKPTACCSAPAAWNERIADTLPLPPMPVTA